MTGNYCPKCGNHCPADALKCPRGEKHFGIRREEQDFHTLSADERIITFLRKCGHHLHHNVGRGADTASLIDVLTADEKSALEALLQKCLEHWQDLSGDASEK